LNLVVNAVQAMSAVAVADRVREVLITTAQAGPNGVLVGVADFGSGLDPASIGRIFDPFYSTKSGALEMGLSVCRSIVATLGGRLSVKPNIPRCQMSNDTKSSEKCTKVVHFSVFATLRQRISLRINALEKIDVKSSCLVDRWAAEFREVG